MRQLRMIILSFIVCITFMNVECADKDFFEKHAELKKEFDVTKFMLLPTGLQAIVLEYLMDSDIQFFNDTECEDNHQVLCNLNGVLIGNYLSYFIYHKKRDLYQGAVNNCLHSFCEVKYKNPESNYYHVVSTLIALGADVHDTYGYRQTPLHRAAYNGNDCLIRLLVEQGADCCVCNKDGSTPRQNLVTRDGSNMKRLLQKTEMKQKAMKAKNRLNDNCSIS